MELTPIRVVIVDDEPDARRRLSTLLEGCTNVQVIAQCADGAEAARVLTALLDVRGVDVLFLDVQMPELDGFEVVQFLAANHSPDALPAIVFVTAFDDYAIRAFDVSAVDYLLKPYDRERFERAFDRASAKIKARQNADIGGSGLQLLLSQLRHTTPEKRYGRHFVTRVDHKLLLVHVGDVEWLDVEGNYVRLHTRSGTHPVRDALGAIEARLDPEDFIRVHRSVIVRLDRIVSLEPYFHGEYVITMRDGSKITASRTHASQLRARLG